MRLGSPAPRNSRSSHGYTFVELMMAITVFAIGIGGIIAMQKVTIASNAGAKNLSIATHIAQSWLDELQADSAQWNGVGDFNETEWLGNVGAEDTANAAWFRPTYSSTRLMGPGFDALGNAVATADLATDAHFCSDLRLTWLGTQSGVKQGAGLIRVEVRVYWLREALSSLSDTIPASVCALNATQVNDPVNQRMFHFVYLSTAVRQYLGNE
jgi:type IV pilus assembly protein PilV